MSFFLFFFDLEEICEYIINIFGQNINFPRMIIDDSKNPTKIYLQA